MPLNARFPRENSEHTEAPTQATYHFHGPEPDLMNSGVTYSSGALGGVCTVSTSLEDSVVADSSHECNPDGQEWRMENGEWRMANAYI
jgi:hypothetical protein